MAIADDPAVGGLTDAEVGHRRLLIVDDHAIVQLGLRALLASQTWVERCIATDDPGHALDLSARYRPHVALVDLFIGEASGMSLCEALRAQRPEIAVLLMSGSGRVSAAVARSVGAKGFVPKSWPTDKIVHATKLAASGARLPRTRASTAHTSNLSFREVQVLRQIAAGASNPEAARALHLSPHTVKQYTSSLYRKLDASNRTDAVLRAQRLGLIY